PYPPRKGVLMPHVSAGHRLLPLLALVACLAVCRPLLARPAAPPARPPLDGSVVAPLSDDNVSGVFAVRLGEIFDAPGMAPLAEQVNQFPGLRLREIGLPFDLPIRVQDVEQVTGRIDLRIDEDRPPPNQFFGGAPYAVRMRKPFDWVGLLKR